MVQRYGSITTTTDTTIIIVSALTNKNLDFPQEDLQISQ